MPSGGPGGQTARVVDASLAVFLTAGGVHAYSEIFAVAAAVTFLATPLVRRFVVAAGVIDQPSNRRVHPKPTPTMGGLAMYLGFLAALASAWSRSSAA